MNTIDYYREFLSMQDISFIDEEDGQFNMDLNLYLMVNLKNCEKISIRSRGNRTFVKHGIHADNDEYIIFMPFNEYRFVIANGINTYMRLYIYDKFDYFATDNIELINWLFCKDRLSLARDYITTNAQILYKQSPRIRPYKDYGCSGDSKLMKLINNAIKYPGISYDNSFFTIYNKSKKIGYVNISKNMRYTFDKQFKGHYLNDLYYYRIDKERSILVAINRTLEIAYIFFYINDKIITVNTALESFKIIFKLIKRLDIYNFIKKVH